MDYVHARECTGRAIRKAAGRDLAIWLKNEFILRSKETILN